MNSTPMTISSTAPMLVSRSWLSRRRSPSAVAVSPRRMKTVENEAMKSRLGTSTRRQSVALDLVDADAGDHREVAGDERQDAGGEEGDQPGGEGDRDVRSVDGVHAVFVARAEARGQLSAAARRRRCSRASSCRRRARRRSRPSPGGSGRAARRRLGLADQPPGAPRAPSRSRPRPRRRTPAASRGSGSPPSARRAAPAPRGPRRESLPGAARAAPAPPLCRRGRAGSAQARRGRAVARIERQRLAQRGLVAGGGELVGGRGDQRVEEALDLRRRDRAGELGDDLAVAKRLHGGDAADVEALRRALWFASTSTFASATLPPRLCDRGLERRAELPARPAPLGPEVDDDRAARATARRPRSMKFASLTSLITAAVEVSERAESTRWLNRTSTARCAGSC